MAKICAIMQLRKESQNTAIPAHRIKIFYHRKIEFTENFYCLRINFIHLMILQNN